MLNKGFFKMFFGFVAIVLLGAFVFVFVAGYDFFGSQEGGEASGEASIKIEE